MSENNQNKPFVDMVRVNEMREQSLRFNDLQRRIRVIESRLPDFERLTTSVASTTIAQSSNHTHTMSQITDNVHGSLPGIEDDDHPQYAEIANTESITGVWSFGAVQINFAAGTTYKIEADGDATFKDLSISKTTFINPAGPDPYFESNSAAQALKLYGVFENTAWIQSDGVLYFKSGTAFFGQLLHGITAARNWTFPDHTGNVVVTGGLIDGNILMGGTTTDDERLQIPYLTQVPASAANGSLWMEADGLHGYLGAAERNLSRPHCLDTYIDIKERQAVWNIHGGILSISTANALNTDPVDITDTIGIGKIIIVINAGGDVDGEITITGTSVDRETGAETGADTDTITVDTLSTDNSGVDSGGNVTYAFVNAYMSSKWFKGAITLSTVDLTLTDVDIYQCSFEQFNDAPHTVIDTIDTNQLANNTAANIYWHLYSVKPTGDKVVLALEESMELEAADVSADLYYRLRRGNLAITIDGATQGFFVQCYPEPLANVYWEDINLKIWYT